MKTGIMCGIAIVGIACNWSAIGGGLGKQINKLPGPVQEAVAPITVPVDAANDLANGKAPSMGEVAPIATYEAVPIGGDWFIRIEVGDDAGNSEVRYVTPDSGALLIESKETADPSGVKFWLVFTRSS